MNGYCFEQYLIDNCSPTLASLKTANLFNYRYSSTDELNKAVERWNKELSGKGITVTVLRKRENTALIYVYRAKRILQRVRGYAHLCEIRQVQSCLPKDVGKRQEYRAAYGCII